jgi:hypothetical protein
MPRGYKGVKFAVLNGTEQHSGIRCLLALINDERERQ